MNFSKRARFALGLFFSFGIAFHGFAADGKEFVSQHEADLKRLSEAASAALDTVAAAVDKEDKAGALVDQIATRQRQLISSLRTYFAPSDQPSLGASHAAIDAAWQAYNEAAKARADFQRTTAAPLRDNAIAFAVDQWRSARRPDDLEESLGLLPSIDQETGPFAPWRSEMEARSLAPWRGRADHLRGTVDLLTRSQGLLRALDHHDSNEVERWARDLRAYFSPEMGQAPTEVKDWLEHLAAEIRPQAKALKEKIDRMIVEDAPLADISPPADLLDALTSSAHSLAGGIAFDASGSFPGLKPETPRARIWVKVLQAVEAGDWKAAATAATASELSEGRVTGAVWKAVVDKRAQIAKQRAEAAEARRATLRQAIRERAAAVADADAVERLADQLHTEQSATNQTPDAAADLGALEGDLLQIASLFRADARMGNLQFLDATSTAESWAPEIKALRNRAIRSVVVRQLSAAELLSPPLDALPLPQAIRQLERDLFAKAEWTRLYQLLTDSDAGGGTAFPTEGPAALKALLVGQNLEKAEQYADAIESYRQVLARVGELVPVAAAADRLKALNREHPEAFKTKNH